MPPSIQQTLEQLRTVYGKMTRRARIIAGLSLGLAVALLAYVVAGDHTTWEVLYSRLSTEDASRIREQLIKDRVPYKLAAGGATVLVPAKRVYEARLQLAANKLPRGSSVGLELMDKNEMGYSEFTNKVNYWRGMQGELERTFKWIEAVSAARVLIAMPHHSIFARKQNPTSASVTLKMHRGRSLPRSKVKGIVHMVSSSVAGLSPSRVTVVDTEGRVLWKPNSQDDPGNIQDYQTVQEASLERKLAEHLNATVGQGKWTGSVTVEVEPATVEQTETEYNPDKTVVLSEGKQESKQLRNNATAGGIPGARGNLPGGPAPTARTAQGGTAQKNKTVNYAPSVMQRKKSLPAGRLKRLSVVVAVDRAALLKSSLSTTAAATGAKAGKGAKKDKKAATKLAAANAAKLETLRKDLEEVVRNAVGYSATRGDKVVVKAVPFVQKAAVAAVAPTLVTRMMSSTPAIIGLGLGAAVVVALVVFLVLRRRRKDEAQVVDVPKSVQQLEAELEHGEPLALAEGDRQARDLAQAAAAQDSLRSAAVLRAWMAGG